MIKATPAPKVVTPVWLVLVYAYATVLAVLAVVVLMGIGGFDFAGITYTTPGTPELAITVAFLHIFSLPFLLRLPLSPMARFISATFSLVTPFFLLAVLGYLASQSVITLQPMSLFGVGLLALVGVASFAVLNGPAAVRLTPRKKRRS